MSKIHKFRFEKLIRDKSPSIMQTEGITSEMRVMEQNEYIEKLKLKIMEEAREVAESSRENLIEEIADVFEVAYCLARANGFEIGEIERLRQKKFVERGGFEDKIYVSYVTATRPGRLFDYMKSKPEEYPEID